MKDYETLKEIIDQLEMPDYQTSDGLHKLSDNAAFQQLKALPQFNTNIKEGLEQMSNNYKVIDGCYVIPKQTLDAYIETIQ